MTAKPQLSTIPVDQVEIVEGFNPRSVIREDSPSFRQLVDSLRELGLLQPILVGAKRNGRYPIIAGERRFRASRKARLREVPAMIAPHLAGSELAAAMAENDHREDLTPLEQAANIKRLQEQEGLTQPKVAKRMKRSERWVRERLRILRLPEPIQGAIGAGAIPIEAIPNLERVAKVSGPLAELLVTEAMSAEAELEPGDLRDASAVTGAIADIEHRPKKDVPFVMSAGSWTDPLERLRGPEAKRIRKERDQIELPEYHRRMSVSDADIKAAREHGCLLELGGDEGYATTKFITDPELMLERCRKKLPSLKREAKAYKQREQRHKRELTPEEETRRREREEQVARATQTNLELGVVTGERLTRVKPTAQALRIVALCATGSLGTEASGCLPEGERSGASAALAERIIAAKSPEEILGLALQAIVRAEYSNREGEGAGWWTLPSLRDHDVDEGDWNAPTERGDALQAAVDELVTKRDLLPEELAERIATRAKEREKRARQRAGEESGDG